MSGQKYNLTLTRNTSSFPPVPHKNPTTLNTYSQNGNLYLWRCSILLKTSKIFAKYPTKNIMNHSFERFVRTNNQNIMYMKESHVKFGGHFWWWYIFLYAPRQCYQMYTPDEPRYSTYSDHSFVLCYQIKVKKPRYFLQIVFKQGTVILTLNCYFLFWYLNPQGFSALAK